MDVFSTERQIRHSFDKTSEFPGGGGIEPTNPLLGRPLALITDHPKKMV
jgi:hypothetical protein